MDSHSEFSDRKRCRDENPEFLPSPEQSRKKRSRKKKNKGALSADAEHLQSLPEPKEKGSEPNEASVKEQPQVCPKHEPAIPVEEVVVDTAIPIVPEKIKGAEPNEAAAEHPVPVPVPELTPKKRKWEKKKKNVVNRQGEEPKEPNAEHPQLVDPAIPIDREQKKNMEGKGAGPNEGNDAVQPQVCNKHEPAPLVLQGSAIPIVPEKRKGVEPSETTAAYPQLCSKHELAPPVDLGKKKGVGPNGATAENPEQLFPVPDPAPPKGTPQKKKWERKKKNVLNAQGVEPKDPNNAEHPQLCSPLNPEPKNKKEKGAEPNEANAEHPRVCPKPLLASPLNTAIQIDPEKKKGAEPTEANAEHPQVYPKAESAPPVDPAIPKNSEKKKEAEPNEAHAEHPQPQPQPCSKLDPAPPVEQTTPIDQSRRKQRNRRGRKGITCSEEKVENQRNPLQGTLNHPMNQTQPDPAFTIDQAMPVDPAIPIGPTLSICPKPAPLIGQTTPVDPAIPIDPEQKMVKKKRKKKRKSVLDGAEPNKHNTEPPETPVQTSTCPVAAPPIDPTIPIGPAIPTDPEQKTTKKKRRKTKKSALKSEGAEPNELNGKTPETPVQRSICPIAAPSLDETIPIDPATPIDPEQQMTKKKRKKKGKSALKREGSGPDEHNAEPTAETPVQRTKGLAFTKVPFNWLGESSMSKRKAEPHAKTPVQRTKGVTKVPFKRHGESSMICRACQQPGHKFQYCPRLKCLSKDEEICFFCGEIGHSLGKCSVSQAGGGRFAKCLFCFAHGHFSNNCPRNGHGIGPKMVAANGPINKTVETEGKSIAEVTNM